MHHRPPGHLNGGASLGWPFVVDLVDARLEPLVKDIGKVAASLDNGIGQRLAFEDGDVHGSGSAGRPLVL